MACPKLWTSPARVHPSNLHANSQISPALMMLNPEPMVGEAQRGIAGHGVSAAGYHEDEQAPRLVRGLVGRHITFAAAGLANSGHIPTIQTFVGAVLMLGLA